MEIQELVEKVKDNEISCYSCCRCVDGKCLHMRGKDIPKYLLENPWMCPEFWRGSQLAYWACKKKGTSECPGYVPNNMWRLSRTSEYCMFCKYAGLEFLENH